MAREPFNEIWANNPNPSQFEEPPTTTFESGWEGGADKDPPQAKWENWWHNRVDNALQDLERGGAMEWLSDVPYKTGSEVAASDGNTYIAVQDSQAADPSVDDGTNWILKPLGFVIAETGHVRLIGDLAMQWIRVTGLSGPGTAVGDTITHTFNYDTTFAETFSVVASGFNDPEEPGQEGSELNIGVVSAGGSSVEIRATRTTGSNAGEDELFGVYIQAIGRV